MPWACSTVLLPEMSAPTSPPPLPIPRSYLMVGFSDLNRRCRRQHLFPSFAERVISAKRSERPDYPGRVEPATRHRPVGSLVSLGWPQGRRRGRTDLNADTRPCHRQHLRAVPWRTASDTSTGSPATTCRRCNLEISGNDDLNPETPPTPQQFRSPTASWSSGTFPTASLTASPMSSAAGRTHHTHRAL